MATHTDALSLVYARSLYELAEQAGGRDKIEEVADELEQICELAREDRRFGEFLASPIVDKAARGEAVSRMFSNRVTDLTLRFLLVLNQKERLGHIESINDAFSSLVQQAFGRVEVDVFTASPLGDEQLDTIRQRIQDAIGKEPILHRYGDPSMIGGIKLRIGDQLIDGSVASQLRRMREQMMVSGGAALRDRAARIIEESVND